MKKHKISQILDFVAAQGRPVRRKEIVQFICDLNNKPYSRGYYSCAFSGYAIFRYTKNGLKSIWKCADLRFPHKWDNRYLKQDENGLYYVCEREWIPGDQYVEIKGFRY